MLGQVGLLAWAMMASEVGVCASSAEVFRGDNVPSREAAYGKDGKAGRGRDAEGDGTWMACGTSVR